MQRNTTPQLPPSPVSIDEPAYRGFNAEERREDPVGTVDAPTEEEDMVAVNIETGAMEPASTTTEIRTTPEPVGTAQMTETPEAVVRHEIVWGSAKW